MHQLFGIDFGPNPTFILRKEATFILGSDIYGPILDRCCYFLNVRHEHPFDHSPLCFHHKLLILPRPNRLDVRGRSGGRYSPRSLHSGVVPFIAWKGHHNGVHGSFGYGPTRHVLPLRRYHSARSHLCVNLYKRNQRPFWQRKEIAFHSKRFAWLRWSQIW